MITFCGLHIDLGVMMCGGTSVRETLFVDMETRETHAVRTPFTLIPQNGSF
jgi:hypothetical protein